MAREIPKTSSVGVSAFQSYSEIRAMKKLNYSPKVTRLGVRNKQNNE